MKTATHYRRRYWVAFLWAYGAIILCLAVSQPVAPAFAAPSLFIRSLAVGFAVLATAEAAWSADRMRRAGDQHGLPFVWVTLLVVCEALITVAVVNGWSS